MFNIVSILQTNQSIFFNTKTFVSCSDFIGDNFYQPLDASLTLNTLIVFND